MKEQGVSGAERSRVYRGTYRRSTYNRTGVRTIVPGLRQTEGANRGTYRRYPPGEPGWVRWLVGMGISFSHGHDPVVSLLSGIGHKTMGDTRTRRAGAAARIGPSML